MDDWLNLATFENAEQHGEPAETVSWHVFRPNLCIFTDFQGFLRRTMPSQAQKRQRGWSSNLQLRQ